MNLKDLAKPFPEKDVKWRVGSRSKDSATLLAYIDARLVQDRFDEVCGPENWEVDFDGGPDGGIKCGIRVRTPDGWVLKSDGAPKTQIEGVKGGYSDAFKRAAVCWGVFRYGYRIPSDWHKFCSKGPGTVYVPANSKFKEKGFVRIPKLPAWARPLRAPTHDEQLKAAVAFGAVEEVTDGALDIDAAALPAALSTLVSANGVVDLWSRLPKSARTDKAKALFAARRRELS